MAGRNIKPGPNSLDSSVADKMHSNTLKRHPKMDLSRNDLLQLLSYLEGELQARDIVIATLRAEKAKQLLYQAKYGRVGLCDPFTALQRDSDNLKDNTFDESAIKSMYDNQLAQLENLIATQRKAQLKMREQLTAAEKRYHKVCAELEEEKRKHAQDTAQGDDVTYMLEKERERLRQEIEFEKSQTKKMEKDLKKTLANLEEERANSAKHKQVALLLIKERKNLIEKMLLERKKHSQMDQLLNDEKNKTMNMAEGLMQESKKSLQMEAAMEKQFSEFDMEREQFRKKLAQEENRNGELQVQIESLKAQLESLKKQLMERSGSRDVFQSMDVQTSGLHTKTSSEKTGNQLMSSPLPISVPGNPGLAKSTVKSTKPVVSENNIRIMTEPSEREANLSPRQSLSPVEGSAWRSVRHGSPQASLDRTVITLQGASDSHGKLETRVAPVGAVSSEKNVSEIYQTPKVSVSSGSMASVVTSGGRISVHVGSGGGGQAVSTNVQSSPRKVVTVGRGVPPPLPPNKPVLASSPTSLSKPATPPKAVATIMKDRGGGGGSFEVGSPTSQPGLKAVQIPINVVHTTSAGSASGSRTPKQDGSPIRKPTQFTATTNSLDALQPESQTDKATPFSTSQLSASLPDSFDFLGPEMADLQQLLVSMVTDSSNPSGMKKQKTEASCVGSSPLFSSSSSSPQSSLSTLATSISFELPSSPIHKYAANGNLESLRKLILELDADVNLPMKDGTTPIHCAAEAGQEKCLNLLLSNGGNSNSLRDDQYSPVHAAARMGHYGCLQLLLSNGGNVNMIDQSNWTPLHWATSNGHTNCCHLLLEHGAKLNAFSSSNWSPVHNAVHGGHLDCLKLMLTFRKSQSDVNDIQEVLQMIDKDGWTITHLAALRESPDCLSVIIENCDFDLKMKDRWGRSVIDVSSAKCWEYLSQRDAAQVEQLNGNVASVSVELKCSGSAYERMNGYLIGCVQIGSNSDWQQIEKSVLGVLNDYYKQLNMGLRTKKTSRLDPESSPDAHDQYVLGLTVDSVWNLSLGSCVWTVGNYPVVNPQEIMCNNYIQKITVTLRDAPQSCDSIAYDLLFPVTVLQNYLRLLDQYKSVIFYGPKGTRKTELIKRLAQHIAERETNSGKEVKVIHVHLHKDFSHKDLVRMLKQQGCMVPIKSDQAGSHFPILVLYSLEQVQMSEFLGVLLSHIEHRGHQHAFSYHEMGDVWETYFFSENFYLLAAMNKTRSTGLDLSIQQRFRWVHFRIDIEPMRNFLARWLLRQLIHINGGCVPEPDSQLFKAVEWLVCIWQRLNDGLTKLGLPDVVFGPEIFLSCPIDAKRSVAIYNWLKELWNETIAHVVKAAVLKGTGREPTADGQEKVADTALYILMQRAIIPGCPMSNEGTSMKKPCD
ncbi:hypothetical protein CHS0354_029909 [Potamilus streckersoni]|uniref:Cortactin-binding protein 2 n=1 Tax=Potamilus streckersoni TaxID=2493646 RepID=A0AAE0RT34_9BIVA|nr:hypothetical protein CHS0354_029909 [Potamilus streckersoni]